jgi:hypothetical protein
MIKNQRLIEEFEKEYKQNEKSDYFSNLRIFEALYEEACSFGIFPLKDPLEGIEEKVRFAKALNVSFTP